MAKLTFSERVARRLAGMVDRVKICEPLVALTFDDGPDPASTPAVLEVLQYFNAKATFFCVGERAEAFPELIKRMKKEGHAVGNHSWNHERFPDLVCQDRILQMGRTERCICQKTPKLFRPPYGDYSKTVAFDVWRKGYVPIGWDVLLWDWIEREPEKMLRILEEKTQPGSIVLMHDALYKYYLCDYPERDVLLRVLEEWLTQTRERFTYVTVPYLLSVSDAYVRRRILRTSPPVLSDQGERL
jgi:peptidoglycan/xylan/chitin deacetylase (PgdA/CDA1 family)